MPDYNLKKIKTDLSGNKYLKTDNQESAIIDTFANKNNNEKEDINKDILVENERLVMENKRQKEELNKIKKEIIPRMNDRFQEVENENTFTIKFRSYTKKGSPLSLHTFFFHF